MPEYLVRKVYKYTVDVVVTADSEDEAIEKAKHTDDELGDRNHDDWLYDIPGARLVKKPKATRR